MCEYVCECVCMGVCVWVPVGVWVWVCLYVGSGGFACVWVCLYVGKSVRSFGKLFRLLGKSMVSRCVWGLVGLGVGVCVWVGVCGLVCVSV